MGRSSIVLASNQAAAHRAPNCLEDFRLCMRLVEASCFPNLVAQGYAFPQSRRVVRQGTFASELRAFFRTQFSPGHLNSLHKLNHYFCLVAHKLTVKVQARFVSFRLQDRLLRKRIALCSAGSRSGFGASLVPYHASTERQAKMTLRCCSSLLIEATADAFDTPPIALKLTFCDFFVRVISSHFPGHSFLRIINYRNT